MSSNQKARGRIDSKPYEHKINLFPIPNTPQAFEAYLFMFKAWHEKKFRTCLKAGIINELRRVNV